MDVSVTGIFRIWNILVHGNIIRRISCSKYQFN